MSVSFVHCTPEAEKLVAHCARVSSPNQNNPEYEKLISYCIKNKHWSILEMASLCLEIQTTRAIAQQIIRHRSFHFQEFCISGDSKISCILPSGKILLRSIEKLFKLQNDKRASMLVRVYDEATKQFVIVKIKEVFKTGTKDVWKVTLNNGKQIKSTLEHKFLTKDGFSELSKLNVGDILATNGIDAWQNKDWLEFQKQKAITEKTGLLGIASAGGCSSHTIRKWLKKYSLQFSKKEVASYTQAWNKGLPAEQQPMFNRLHSDDTRNKQSKSARKGLDSNLYKSGNNRSWRSQVADWQTKYKNKLVKNAGNKCSICSSDKKLEIDHIIPVSQSTIKAFDYNNLQILCNECHKNKSKLERKESVYWSAIASIEYVGKEQTYDMEVDHSSHNYIANGIVTHNSQRYAPVAFNNVVFMEARRQDKKNRQNSIDDLPEETKEWFLDAQEQVADLSMSLYNEALNKNIAKESARFLLPLGINTKLFMHGTLRDWCHYINLRTENGTQKEHADIALECKKIFIEQFPIIAKALEWK